MELVQPVIDLGSLPDWALLVGACTSTTLLVCTVRWISSGAARRDFAVRMGLAVAVFVVYLVRNQHARTTLWFIASCCAVLAAWLAWLGPMPSDMPGATDPRCRLHPDYPRVARRSRIAGLAWIATSTLLLIATQLWIKGL